jgi:hypothetical protein
LASAFAKSAIDCDPTQKPPGASPLAHMRIFSAATCGTVNPFQAGKAVSFTRTAVGKMVS